jgi:hypothetical protein
VAIATDLAAEAGEAELVAVSAGCHVALAAAVAGAPAARVVLWEPPDFQATPVSAELYDRLDRAAASGDRKLLVRLLLNEVVGVNTGSCSANPASSAPWRRSANVRPSPSGRTPRHTADSLLKAPLAS